MKILLCSPTYECFTHGPAKFAKLLLRLPELFPDAEVRLLTEDVEQSLADKIYKYERNYPRGIGVFWEYWDNYLLYRKLKEIQTSYPFDVVIFNNALQGLRSAKKLDAKILTVGLINDNEYIRNTIGKISFSKEWFVKWKSRLLEKRAAKTLDLIISNSNYLKEEIQKAYNLPNQKVVRMYKSIDLDNFPPQNVKEIDTEQDVKILFVKNDYVRGGLYVLIDALNLLSQFRFKLNYAGMTARDNDKIIAHKKFAHVSLNYLGQLSQKEVYQQMISNDIFCVPSLREGLGVANIEALSGKIPVVSTLAGGIPEVLDQGANGWLAKTNDSTDLAEQINACIQEAEQRYLKTAAGYNYIQEHFNYKVMLSNLYHTIKSNVKA